MTRDQRFTAEGGDTHPGRGPDDAVDQAAAVAALGLRGNLAPGDVDRLVDLVSGAPDPRVRVAALGALCRSAPRRAAGSAWRIAARDTDASVRRRAADVAPALGRGAPTDAVVDLLRDRDHLVAEAAAWALGERAASPPAVAALSAAATGHPDPLVREAAVAALGALGDPAGLPAILAGCADKTAVRRRAVLALAPFDGPEVDAAIDKAMTDRDWQVRQAAEDLRG